MKLGVFTLLLSTIIGLAFSLGGCQTTTAKVEPVNHDDRIKFKNNLPLCKTDTEANMWTGCLGSITAFNNLSKYVGEFKDGEKHGRGIYTSAKGSKYTGEWKNGMLNGFGTFEFWFGDTYIGEWKDDKFHGSGTWIKASKEQYMGKFKNGVKHGAGTITFADGSKQSGLWQNGEVLTIHNIELPDETLCTDINEEAKCIDSIVLKN